MLPHANGQYLAPFNPPFPSEGALDWASLRRAAPNFLPARGRCVTKLGCPSSRQPSRLAFHPAARPGMAARSEVRGLARPVPQARSRREHLHQERPRLHGAFPRNRLGGRRFPTARPSSTASSSPRSNADAPFPRPPLRDGDERAVRVGIRSSRARRSGPAWLPLAGRKPCLRDSYKSTRTGCASPRFRRRRKAPRPARRMGLEGIVSKRRDSPYRSGIKRDWIKVKCEAWREANRAATNSLSGTNSDDGTQC